MRELADRRGYDEEYADRLPELIHCDSCDELVREFYRTHLAPFYAGGTTKGYVRGLAARRLLEFARSVRRDGHEPTILEAGSGLGDLSTFLACKGFRVIGLDISPVACHGGRRLSIKLGMEERARFCAASLGALPLRDECIDSVIGFASLHHFIKYAGVPAEFWRVMRPGARGFFADSFGENRLYHLFHNRERMRRLGDVVLTRDRIYTFFQRFEVRLLPTDWFTMLDKLNTRWLPGGWRPYCVECPDSTSGWIGGFRRSPGWRCVFLARL